MRKILYSAVFDGRYPFQELFDTITTVTEADQMVDEAAALVIWGGGDISPSLYGHDVSPHTGATADPSRRDLIEWELANKAVSMGMPVIGVCRGAQIMCALSGGHLIQDVTGHTNSHNMHVLGGDRVMVSSSLHHQMMFPWGVEHEIIAEAFPDRSKHYLTRPKNSQKDIEIEALPCEPEIVWFPKTKALAIQGHPEFMGVDTPYVQYCFELVKKYVV